MCELFAVLLADRDWIPVAYQTPAAESGMGGGIGQWLVFRAAIVRCRSSAPARPTWRDDTSPRSSRLGATPPDPCPVAPCPLSQAGWCLPRSTGHRQARPFRSDYVNAESGDRGAS